VLCRRLLHMASKIVPSEGGDSEDKAMTPKSSFSSHAPFLGVVPTNGGGAESDNDPEADNKLAEWVRTAGNVAIGPHADLLSDPWVNQPRKAGVEPPSDVSSGEFKPGAASPQNGRTRWHRIRLQHNVTKTADAVVRQAQAVGSAHVLTLNQLQQANNPELRSLLGGRCVVLPTAQPKKLWDLIVMIILAFSAVLVPYRVAFFETAEDLNNFGTWSIVEVVMDVLLMIDVVLSFFTAYEVDNTVVVDPRKIAWHYLTGWFVIDFVASFPISLFLPSVGSSLRGVRLLRLPRMLKLLKVLRLLRVARVIRASRYMRMIQQYVNLNPAIMRLVVFLCAFMLFVHVAGCLWYLVAEVSDFEPDSWVVRYQIVDQPLEAQYVASIYFSTTLLTTTGLGDIVPLTVPEQVFTVFLEMSGVTLVSYTTSTITGLIGSFDARARRRREKFEEVERFMDTRGLSKRLRAHVRDFYELLLASKVSAVDESKIMNELSSPLQTAVTFETHRDIISKFGFFKHKPAEFVRDILKAARPLSVQHGRVVFSEGASGQSLYLIASGRITFEASDGTPYLQLPSGSVFGVIALLCTGRQVLTAKATGYSLLYVVSRRDVEKILDDYPDIESELLALALARLRRIQTQRRAMKGSKGKTKRPTMTELQTDAIMQRALEQPLERQLARSARTERAAPGRRASDTALLTDVISAGFKTGTSERVAFLRHIAETRTYRRLSLSKEFPSRDDKSPPKKELSPRAAVARAMSNPPPDTLTGEGTRLGQLDDPASKASSPREGGTSSAHRAVMFEAGLGNAVASVNKALQSRTKSMGKMEDTPVLDAAARSRRHSIGTSQLTPEETKFLSARALDLERQTESLIDQTLRTAKRAVSRRERLVTRIAAERERRQFTSRPAGYASLQPPPEPPAPYLRSEASVGRSSSQVLRDRAKSLRAKLTQQRRKIHEGAREGMSPKSRRSLTSRPAAADGKPRTFSFNERPDVDTDHAVTPPLGESGIPSIREHAPESPQLDAVGLTLAIQEMNATLHDVSSAIMGLQVEQEAIVDLLIAVLAEEGSEPEALEDAEGRSPPAAESSG
jgi:CRP-like cAMP-binding protein